MQVQTPVDPNVRVPAAVQAAAARANEFFAASETASEKSGESAPEQTTDPAASPQPVVELQKTPEPQKAGEESWEHRYNSMKGRYDSAERRAQTMQRQIANLENVIATLQAAPPPQPAATTAHDTKPLITAEDREQYGEDFLAVVGRKAREEFASELQELRDRNARLEAQLTGVGNQVQMSARERMFAALEHDVPAWRDLNNDQQFNEWLDLSDPYSGAKRKDMLIEAYNRNDAFRVAAFFKGFLSEEAALNPADTQPHPAEAAKAPSRKVPLENLAAPGRARTAAAKAPEEKPVFTRDQISKFYAQKAQLFAKGQWVGQLEKDGAAFEQQLFSAEREGRIR